MKYTINICLFSLLIIAACSPDSKEQSDDEFSISGNVPTVSSGKAVLYRVADLDLQAIDSVPVKDGSFTFSGKLEEPEMLYIKVNNGRELIRVFAGNESISIEATPGNFENAEISGSELNDLMEDFKEEYMKKRQEIASAFSNYQSAGMSGDTTGLTRKLKNYHNAQDDFDNFIKDFAISNGSTAAGPYIVLRYLTDRLSVAAIDSIRTEFTEEVQNSLYGKELTAHLEKLQSLEPGQPAPDFILNDPEGNPRSLASFKGNYLLVDFWASWCGPCREENPNLVRIKDKYEDKGFEILSVSLDTKKDAWLEAVENDEMDWAHVSDLQGWKSSAGQLYGVNSIPHTLLLDKEGRIIAKDLRGEDLEKKLDLIFSEGT